MLVVALAVSPDGKLGISLRDGERGIPIVSRGRVDGLLEAGDHRGGRSQPSASRIRRG